MNPLIKSDPLATREKSLKTLLSIPSGVNLSSYFAHELSNGSVATVEYLVHIWIERPEDFSISEGEYSVTLMFMNVEVISWYKTYMVVQVKDVRSFFEYWGQILGRRFL